MVVSDLGESPGKPTNNGTSSTTAIDTAKEPCQIEDHEGFVILSEFPEPTKEHELKLFPAYSNIVAGDSSSAAASKGEIQLNTSNP